MKPGTRFKFLIVHYIEQKTGIEGANLLAFAIHYASTMPNPAKYTAQTNVRFLMQSLADTQTLYLLDEDHLPAYPTPQALLYEAIDIVSDQLNIPIP